KTRRTALKIGGMHCAGCVNSIQKHVSELRGVTSCEVNLAAEKATLEFDPAVTDLTTIEKAVEEIGYKVVYEKLAVKIGNMTDSSDAERLEKKLKELEGIRYVSVSFGNGQILVEYNPTLHSLSDIRQVITKNGYQILSEDLSASAEEVEANKLKKFFFIGLVFTIPVLIFGYPEFFSFVPLAGTFYAAYLVFACASVVQFVTGSRFYIGAYRIGKMKSANMDTLVVTGTTAAYLFSAINTFPTPAWHNIYFDAASVVITFIILGKYLENKTKGKASSLIRKMLELQPKTARIKKDGQETDVPIEIIKPGDVILVRPGEKIPIDSLVLEGNSAVDESMVTGESMPVNKKARDYVIGGTINREGALEIKAEKVGSDTMLAQVVKLVEEAMGRKPPMQRMVDKIAGYFAFVVIGVALATFMAWYLITPMGAHQIATSIIPAVAILVVACPCALGLATPTAIMVGMSKAAQNGVIFKGGDSLEMLGRVKIAVFDKTGTLTRGKPQVTDIMTMKQIGFASENTASVVSSDHKILEIAAMAEKNSEHPLAKSIVQHALDLKISLAETREFFAIPGKGVKTVYNGHKILVGSPRFMEEEHIDIESSKQSLIALQEQGKTVMLVVLDDDLVGLVALLDTPKPSAKYAVKSLKKMGIQVVMLTGDNDRTANTVAEDLEMDKVFANVMPSGKSDIIKQLQKEGKTVMIGDGINDAPALTEADVGIAIGSGTDVALEAGNVVLVRDDLMDVVSAIEISKKTISKIRQNLFYAFAYNVVLIPVAGLGLLYPTLAGLAMAASSVSVTSSSLLLKRWSPPSKRKKLNIEK
ncbi:MAG: copper-translocating P-type ATPase, partial [Thaumarchaeota archaeon]|nr:copper-translocating P-type ATPase [Nitrososphaerota archaeon]